MVRFSRRWLKVPKGSLLIFMSTSLPVTAAANTASVRAAWGLYAPRSVTSLGRGTVPLDFRGAALLRRRRGLRFAACFSLTWGCAYVRMCDRREDGWKEGVERGRGGNSVGDRGWSQ